MKRTVGVGEMRIITPKLNKNSTIPLYIQLYDYLKKEIVSGVLKMDTKLPSIRQLAEYLNLSRTTVEAAYQQLTAEGYIFSRPQAGYYVNALENSRYGKISSFSGNRQKDESLEPAIKYDFKSDRLDKDSFDLILWKRYINKALEEKERFLTYGLAQGEYELRQEISRYVHESRGVICTPSQIVIGAGVQSLLHILCGLLRPACNTIGFEEPGFRQAREVFKDHGFLIAPISLNKDGIDVGDLSQSTAKAVYVSPSHQFPTGSTMQINKRIQLLNWAHDNKTLIIEDDYDSELRYYGRPIPSLQGLGQGGSVIYLGTFSKILLPSLRISFMVLTPDLLAVYEEKRNQYNQTSSKIEQLALARFIRDGHLEKQIKRLRKIYARKNQMLTDAVEKIMKKQVRIIGGESGLYILLEVSALATSEELAAKALAEGIRVTPVSNYFMKGKQYQMPQVLLSFAGIPLEDIKPAVELLNKCWFKQTEDENLLSGKDAFK